MSQELKYTVRLDVPESEIKNAKSRISEVESQPLRKPQKDSTKSIKDTDEALKKKETTLKVLRKTLRGYQEALADVQKEARDQGNATLSNIDVQRGFGQAIVGVKTQIESATKGNIDYTSALDTSAMSVREMKGQLRSLKIAIDEVKDPMGSGAEEVAKLTSRHNELTTQLKTLEGSMGVHTRNVGNYDNAIRSAANALAIWQGPLGPIAGRVNAFATTLNRLTAEKQKAATASVILGKSIMKALIVSGIGALIVVVVSLINWFRRSEEGAEKLRIIMAGLGAVLDTLRERFVLLGGRIAEAFDNPKEAVKGLWEAIKQNIVNRIESVGDMFRALGSIISSALDLDFDGMVSGTKDLANAQIKLFTGVDDVIGKVGDSLGETLGAIRENVNATTDLQRAMNQVLRTERDLGVERAKQNRDLQEARDLARDLEVPFEERLAALKMVRESEEELMARELANERIRLEILEEQTDMFTSSAAEKQKVADQQAKVFDMEREHIQRSISLRRDETSVMRQQNEEAIRGMRRAIDSRNRGVELELKAIERQMTEEGRLVELKYKNLTDFDERYQEERIAREQAYAQELRNIVGFQGDAEAEARLKADEELQLERLELLDQYHDQVRQRDIAVAQSQVDFQVLQLQGAHQNRMNVLELQHNELLSVEEEMNFAKERQRLDSEQRMFEAEEQYVMAGILRAEARAMAERRIIEENEQEITSIKARHDQIRQRNTQQAIDLWVSAYRSGSQAMFGDSKLSQAAAVIVETVRGAQKAFAQNPPPSPVGIASAAAVIAAGASSMRQIMSTRIGSSSISATAPTSSGVSESFGLVDVSSSLGGELLSSQSPKQNMQPNIILEGEFDPEFLSVKVKQGSDALSGRNVSVGL